MFNQKEYSHQYYQRNKHKWKIYRKKINDINYRLRNPERIAQRKRDFVENHYEWNLWIQSRRSAKIKNIEHTITVEDIKIPGICPYLKVPLTRIQGQGVIWTNASIDRIDNTKGYTKDNVQIISRLANSMKRDVSLTQLKQFAISILERHA